MNRSSYLQKLLDEGAQLHNQFVLKRTRKQSLQDFDLENYNELKSACLDLESCRSCASPMGRLDIDCNLATLLREAALTLGDGRKPSDIMKQWAKKLVDGVLESYPRHPHALLNLGCLLYDEGTQRSTKEGALKKEKIMRSRQIFVQLISICNDGISKCENAAKSKGYSALEHIRKHARKNLEIIDTMLELSLDIESDQDESSGGGAKRGYKDRSDIAQPNSVHVMESMDSFLEYYRSDLSFHTCDEATQYNDVFGLVPHSVCDMLGWQLLKVEDLFIGTRSSDLASRNVLMNDGGLFVLVVTKNISKKIHEKFHSNNQVENMGCFDAIQYFFQNLFHAMSVMGVLHSLVFWECTEDIQQLESLKKCDLSNIFMNGISDQRAICAYYGESVFEEFYYGYFENLMNLSEEKKPSLTRCTKNLAISKCMMAKGNNALFIRDLDNEPSIYVPWKCKRSGQIYPVQASKENKRAIEDLVNSLKHTEGALMD